MMSMALGVFVINYFVLDVGGSSAVAGYGISMRIEQIALLPTIGLNIAILSITGQNFGAKNLDRIKKVYKLGLIYGLIIMTTAMFIIFPFSKYFLRLFTDDLEVIKYGVPYLNIETFAFNFYVFLNISVAILQGLKKPNFVIFIGIYRQFLLPLLLFPILVGLLPNPIYGVWVGILIVNWSAVIILVFYTKFKKPMKEILFSIFSIGFLNLVFICHYFQDRLICSFHSYLRKYPDVFYSLFYIFTYYSLTARQYFFCF